MAGGFRRNTVFKLKLRNRCTGSTSLSGSRGVSTRVWEVSVWVQGGLHLGLRGLHLGPGRSPSGSGVVSIRVQGDLYPGPEGLHLDLGSLQLGPGVSIWFMGSLSGSRDVSVLVRGLYLGLGVSIGSRGSSSRFRGGLRHGSPRIRKAGSSHPTRMLSCWSIKLLNLTNRITGFPVFCTLFWNALCLYAAAYIGQLNLNIDQPNSMSTNSVQNICKTCLLVKTMLKLKGTFWQSFQNNNRKFE